MNRKDQRKASLVDFLRSIKFEQEDSRPRVECRTHFAHFTPQARSASTTAEERQLVRSAN